MEGFVFPNEAEVRWSLLIVLYPYLTGLVAGAFIASSLYHVFGIKSLKPVSRFSLMVALSFLLVCPLPLLAHLGRPFRCFNIFLTPNPTSAMAGFGYIWLIYTILVVLETWLSFRADLVLLGREYRGLKGLIFRSLSLGDNISESSIAVDEVFIRALAIIGIPAACILHGYVGFIFGGVKANPWWSTPLMPPIFLLSAIVSGIALLIFLYIAAMKLKGSRIDLDCLDSLISWLLGFLIIDIALEGLEVLSMAYESVESWELIETLLKEKLRVTLFGYQILLGFVAPFILLFIPRLTGAGPGTKINLAFFSSFLILFGIFFMRWNVVIGGQLFSKSMRGFITYTPAFLGREGILAASIIMLLPVVILSIMGHFVSPWKEPIKETLKTQEGEEDHWKIRKHTFKEIEPGDMGPLEKGDIGSRSKS